MSLNPQVHVPVSLIYMSQFAQHVPVHVHASNVHLCETSNFLQSNDLNYITHIITPP